MNYLDLRKKYPEFVYTSYTWEIEDKDLLITFKFNVDDFEFSPTLVIKNINIKRVELIKPNIDALVFNIGLVEMLSYWKAFCSPKIRVDAGYLDNFQVEWWKKLLINGMSQYFYENNIDFTDKDFVSIDSTKESKTTDILKISNESILIPIGGGKDSSVTLEIIKNNYDKVTAFMLNPAKASNETVNVNNIESIIVERKLDPKLIQLKNDYLNGHTPFTALLSFSALLVACVGEYKNIIFSNEQSSNEDNVKYLDKSINHQYSKSLEFENDFREYNYRYLSDVNYFSFLRPIYDIQIAKIFSKFNKYFSIIRSCNVGQKTDTWCGKCPKCLSTFILFYPFMGEEAIKIFNKNLLEDKLLDPILQSLIDENKVKPFECVGTKHELKVALGIEKDDLLLKFWSDGNNLPEDFSNLLKKYI